jgi:hypothetical protein
VSISSCTDELSTDEERSLAGSSEVAKEAAKTEANLKVAAETVVYGLHFRQQSSVLQSFGQPMALTDADPVSSILFPALSVFSPARNAMKLCQL